jgi:hypothetical protein
MLRFEQLKHANCTSNSSDSNGAVVYTLQLSSDTLSIDMLHMFLRFLYSGCIAAVDDIDTYTLMELASIADEFLVSNLQKNSRDLPLIVHIHCSKLTPAFVFMLMHTYIYVHAAVLQSPHTHSILHCYSFHYALH